MSRYLDRATQLAKLVEDKQRQYGNSAGRSGKILAVLYPDGVKTHQYGDVLLVARVLDKLSRIAERGADGKDLGGESPWQDVMGYALLGWTADETPKTTQGMRSIRGLDLAEDGTVIARRYDRGKR